MHSKGFFSSLLRGLIGGALGGFLLVSVPILVNIKAASKGSWGWLVGAYVLVGLPWGSLNGAIVGIALWVIHRQTGAPLLPFARLVIGVLIATAFWALFFWQQDTRGYVQTSWQWNLIENLLLGLATGGLSGLIVGRQGFSRTMPT